jgi:hypothetical protein
VDKQNVGFLLIFDFIRSDVIFCFHFLRRHLARVGKTSCTLAFPNIR